MGQQTIFHVVSVRSVNDQPPSANPPNPAADDPTAVQRPVSGPGASNVPAWDPTSAYQAPPTQPAPPYGAQPEAYGAQPGAYGAQPGSSGAEPGSFGAEPGSYGAQPGSFGPQPGSFGAQPGDAYGAQPGAAYGGQPGPAYGAQQPGAYSGFPAPGDPGHPAPGSGGTSGFAIASLIFGILGGILFSVIFGIVALVQIRKRGQTGRGLAITGLVLSGCWVLLIIVGVTAAILSDSNSSTGSTTGSGNGTVAVTTLKPGDCINGTQGAGTIEDLPVVKCGLPHEGEVFAVFDLPAGPWPGDSAVQKDAEKRCQAEFKRYAPNAADTVKVLYLHPLQQSWTRDRGVTCVATDERGTSTGSVRD